MEYTPIFDNIVNIDDIDLLDAAVFGTMWRYGQQSKPPRCNASRSKIARRLGGVGISTIKRSQQRLKTAKLIVDETPNLRNKTHVYSFSAMAIGLVTKNQWAILVGQNDPLVGQNDPLVGHSGRPEWPMKKATTTTTTTTTTNGDIFLEIERLVQEHFGDLKNDKVLSVDVKETIRKYGNLLVLEAINIAIGPDKKRMGWLPTWGYVKGILANDNYEKRTTDSKSKTSHSSARSARKKRRDRSGANLGTAERKYKPLF